MQSFRMQRSEMKNLMADSYETVPEACAERSRSTQSDQVIDTAS